MTSPLLRDTMDYINSKYQMYKYVVDQSDFKDFGELLKSK